MKRAINTNFTASFVSAYANSAAGRGAGREPHQELRLRMVIVPTHIEPEEAIAPPAIPIPFHKLLKVVALVDRRGSADARAARSDRRGGLRDRAERSARPRRLRGRRASGAYIALVDGDRREQARRAGAGGARDRLRTPLWALADSASRSSDVAALGLTGEVEGYIYLGQQTPAFYAKQVVASIVNYGTELCCRRSSAV